MSTERCIISAVPTFETIKKNGKFDIYLNAFERLMNEYRCLLEDRSLFYYLIQNIYNNEIDIINFNESNNAKFEDEILTKIKKKKYHISILYNKEKKNYLSVLYKEKNIDSLVKYIYIMNTILEDKDYDEIEIMSKIYYINKIRYPEIKDNVIFIQLFYGYYVKTLIDEIEKKYGKNIILDFNNYNELYIFLNKKGYVKEYYKTVKKKIIKYTNIIEEDLKKNKESLKEIKKNIKNNSSILKK